MSIAKLSIISALVLAPCAFAQTRADIETPASLDAPMELSQHSNVFIARGFKGSAGELPTLCGFRNSRVDVGLWWAREDGHCYASDSYWSGASFHWKIQYDKTHKVIGGYWHD